MAHVLTQPSATARKSHVILSSTTQLVTFVAPYGGCAFVPELALPKHLKCG